MLIILILLPLRALKLILRVVVICRTLELVVLLRLLLRLVNVVWLPVRLLVLHPEHAFGLLLELSELLDLLLLLLEVGLPRHLLVPLSLLLG